MKVKHLIAQLETTDQEHEVCVWMDGARFPVMDLDDNLTDCVDLNVSYEARDFIKDAFPYALGYWQGRACGNFENGTYENMTEYHKHLYKLGYDSGIADFAELDGCVQS